MKPQINDLIRERICQGRSESEVVAECADVHPEASEDRVRQRYNKVVAEVATNQKAYYE